MISLSDAQRRLLAERLRGRRAVLAPFEPRPGPSRMPVSPAQQRLLFVDHLAEGSPEYVIPAAWRLRGALDRVALESALRGLAARHESLRTRFVLVQGEAFQEIGAVADVSVSWSRASTEAEVRELAALEAERPFDLSRGPLLRASVWKLADDDHVLLLAMHHIVSDGWSMGVLTRELGELYRGARLPELPIQYADFAQWQRGRDVESQLDYWRERLAGLPALELPADRPRPPVRRTAGAAAEFALEDEVVEALERLSRARGVTIYMTLLAAFQVLLGKWSGQTDFGIGSPIAGRDRAEVEGLIGFFVNTLVMRADLGGDPTFEELLERVRESALGAYEHQDVPFERLVEELRPVRDLGRNPLFQVMFALDEADGVPLQLGAASAERFPLDLRTVKFDLMLQVVRGGRRLEGAFVYRIDLYDGATVERMAAHFTRLLRSAVERPRSRVGELAMLSDDERRLLLADWTRTHEYESRRTLHELFEEHVADAPDAIAVVFGDERLSYDELNRRANRLAHRLRALGVGPDSIVGLCAERGLGLVAGVIGILKAGAAYLPLDPEHPQERLAYVLRDAGVELLVGVPVRGYEGRIVSLDDEAGTDANPEPLSGPESLAYVIYTSGSTGRPKGVCIEHRNVVRLLAAGERELNLAPGGVWTLFHSYAFDFSVWELWGALARGGRLVVVPRDVARDPSRLLSLLESERVTVLNQTPSAFRGLRAAVTERGRPLPVRTVIFGGEKLEAAEVADLAGGVELVNMYGITETTVHVTHKRLTPDDVRSPIGRPLGDLRAYVLDRGLRPVPIGAYGELFVAGAGLARCYLGRPALTAERFLPDPHDGFGERMYRTGDVARFLPGGGLEFLGRLDDQVKVRGHRIELGEVEAALSTHPAVNACAVVVRDGRLVAYVTAPGLPSPAGRGGSLRAHLAERLPAYMVPSAFVELPQLPLTANGKVDRQALPEPDAERPELSGRYEAPATDAEVALAAIWAEAVRVERVGVRDNFFELGGDSIVALRAIGLARQRGLRLELADLFRFQTLGELAQAAELRDGGEPEQVAPYALLDARDRERLPDDVEDAYPLTSMQQGMLYELLADPARGAYHNVTSFLVKDRPDFDLGALQATADRLVERHEILRTSFDWTRFSEPLQLVHRSASLIVGCEDLRDLDRSERTERLTEYLRKEAERRFDLASAPLIRLFVHRLAGDEYRLTITDCHAVLDGWSLTSLIGELIDGGASAPVPVRFADYVALERDALRSDACRDFWRRKLDELEPVHLPSFAGAGIHEAVRTFDELHEGIGRLAAHAGVPRKSVMLAAYYHLLGVFAEGPYASGLVTNGRPERAGAERMRGLFLNTVPFGFRSTARTWTELLRETFAAERELTPYRRYPLAELQRARSNRGPLIETAFNYVHFHGLAAEHKDDVQEIAHTNFALSATVSPWRLSLEADLGRLPVATCEQLADLYVALLSTMVAEPDGPVDRPAVPLAEASRGETVAGYEDLVDAFEAQVDRTPDAPAVADCTYRELDERANRLAWRLRGRGVKPESVVAVLAERGPAAVVGMLAVLKAGGAYLPLEPAAPDQRLAFVVADARAVGVLTDGALRARAPRVGWALDLQASDLAAEPAERPVRVARPENPAYVIYTSGSTGEPKGVVATRRGLANYLGWARRTYAAGLESSAVHSTLAFDLTMTGLWLPLLSGGRVELVGEPGLERLMDELSERKPGLLKLTPVHLDILGALSLRARVLVVGGEQLPAEAVGRWRSQAPETLLVNEYGPTEAVVGCCVHAVPVGELGRGSVPIGRPVPNTSLYVLDRELRPVPLGAPGELYVAGAQVARGYLDRPGLTAERFLPDPFGDPGERMYWTGDVARWLPDGALEYIGRRDGQVKVRGYRVELGEIETRLREIDGVRACAVLARRDQLVGYVAGDVAEEELKRRLRERLPDYMVPKQWITLTALPLTANGKLDRAALPEPEGKRPELAQAYVAPRTAAEARMAAIWLRVLRLRRIGVHDDFFELGGSSLATVRIAALATEAGMPLTVKDLLEHPTVAGACLASTRNASRGEALVVLRAGGGRALYCIHPSGGSAGWYVPLASALPGDRPVIGLQARGLGGGTDASTIEGLAADYVAEIRRRQPEGPYALLGWSLGGSIAHEMAVQLRRQAEHVAPLILLEPSVPDGSSSAAAIALLRRALALRDGGGSERELAEALRAAGATDAEAELGGDSPIPMWIALLEALDGYRPEPYQGPVHLVVTDECAHGTSVVVGSSYEEYERCCRELAAGGLTVHRVAGDHRAMVSASEVATLVARLLEEAR